MHNIEQMSLKKHPYSLNIPKPKSITSDGGRFKLRIQCPRRKTRIFSCSISNGFNKKLVERVQEIFTDLLYSISEGYGIQEEHKAMLRKLLEYFPKLHSKLLAAYPEINTSTQTLEELIHKYKNVYLSTNEQDRDPGRRGTDPIKSVQSKCGILQYLFGKDTNPLTITPEVVIKRFQKLYTEKKRSNQKKKDSSQINNSVTEGTAKTYLSFLLTVFKVCTTYPNNFLPYNPLLDMTAKDIPKKTKKGRKKSPDTVEYISNNDKDAFIKAMSQEMRCTTPALRKMIRAITLLAIYKPFRANEAKDMRWSDIRYSETECTYYINFKINSKSKSVYYREIPIIWPDFKPVLDEWWDYCKTKRNYSDDNRIWYLWGDDPKTFSNALRNAIIKRIEKWNRNNPPIMENIIPSNAKKYSKDENESQRGLHYLRGCGMYWNIENGVSFKMLSQMVGTSPLLIEKLYLRSRRQKEIDLQRDLISLRDQKVGNAQTLA